MGKERLMYIVLGLFLILSGLAVFIPGLSALGVVIAVLALVAGVLIVVAKPGISIFAGWVLAAIYLVLVGLSGLVSLGFSWLGTVMAILALVAGIVLVLKWGGFKKHFGFLLFIVWLILTGLVGLFGWGGMGTVIAIVAAASGLLMILNQ
jgi:hypothetical protein